MTQQSDGGPGNDDPGNDGKGKDEVQGLVHRPQESTDAPGAETRPSRPFKHTRWQNFVRDMFLLFGPAQTGLPPYATAEERENWRLTNLPEPPQAKRTSTAPPGYRMVEYRDGQGYRHRSLVPITPPPAARRQAEQAQPAKPSADAEQE